MVVEIKAWHPSNWKALPSNLFSEGIRFSIHLQVERGRERILQYLYANQRIKKECLNIGPSWCVSIKKIGISNDVLIECSAFLNVDEMRRPLRTHLNRRLYCLSKRNKLCSYTSPFWPLIMWVSVSANGHWNIVDIMNKTTTNHSPRLILSLPIFDIINLKHLRTRPPFKSLSLHGSCPVMR